MLIVLGMGWITGCTRAPGPNGFDQVIGGFGHTSGRFNRPRGIVCATGNNLLFVVDWDGRIQKFTTSGEFRASWRMPEVDKGKPEDLCLTPDGRLLVADTHYSRIVEYTIDGDRVGMFGSYGREPGQFIYPVGIACDPTGNIYVAEYGENDRIQKFRRDGTWIMTWGELGTEPGQLQRPSGIDISNDGLLYVADAVNHRVQVFTLEGQLVRVIGREGTGPGEFRYPYDVAAGNGEIWVLEYGNQRVQRLTPDGAPLAMAGVPGSGDGAFASPWRCALAGSVLYVSDTDNSRVVRLGREL